MVWRDSGNIFVKVQHVQAGRLAYGWNNAKAKAFFRSPVFALGNKTKYLGYVDLSSAALARLIEGVLGRLFTDLKKSARSCFDRLRSA
jgi:hypothetical protein